MKFKETIWLSVLLLAVVLYYFLVDIPFLKEKEEEKDRVEKILLFETKNVDEISIESPLQTKVLKRRAKGQWKLVKPLETDADNDAVQALLSSLHDARFTKLVEENPEDLVIYGLDTPSLKIVLKLKDGEKSVLLGGASPVGSSIYLKRGGESKVLLAFASRTRWDRSVYELRDKTILDFNISDIASMEIRQANKSIQFTQTGNEWKVNSGSIEGKGDSPEITGFLNFIRFSRIKMFVDEAPDKLHSFGLQNPAIALTIHFKDETQQSLLIGDVVTGRDMLISGYYAKIGEAEKVFTLDARMFEVLIKNPLDFFDKPIFEFDPKEVAELRFQLQSGEVRIVRNKILNLWSIVKPIKRSVSSATVENLLTQLKDARFKDLVKNSEGKAPEVYSVDPPRRKVTLLNSKKTVLGSLNIGNRSEGGQNFYITRPGQDALLVVEGDVIDKIFGVLKKLNIAKLLHFQAEDAAIIQVQFSGQSYELKKIGEHWKLAQPETGGKINSDFGDNIIRAMGNLNFASQVEAERAPEITGLDRPTLTVTVKNKKGRELAAIMIGKSAKDDTQLYYAQIRDNPALFQVHEWFVDIIPKNWKDLKI